MSIVEETTTVLVTEEAAKVVADLLVAKNVPDYGLRVLCLAVAVPACNTAWPESEARPYDYVIEAHGIKVFVDPTSMMYVNGATIDYEDSLMGGGFKIDNPNAVSSCGCGHSFKTQRQRRRTVRRILR